jgi:hypothetical protein
LRLKQHNKETVKKPDPTKRTCPCCGRKTDKQFDPAVKYPPMGWLLRQAFKRQRRKPVGRDWRVDPRPLDSIAILDRAYYERPKAGSFKVPVHRTVVQVENDRVYFRTQDEGRVRSCSKATWRRLDADLVARAVTQG